MPPSTSAGKSFTVDTPSDERLGQLRRGRDTRQRRQAGRCAAFDDGAVQAGGNDERRAGGDRDVSPAPTERTVPAPTTKPSPARASIASAAASLRKVISTARSSGAGQRLPELPCGLPALDRDDWEDTLLGDDCQYVGHRPSQPPSTGRTTPCT